MTLGVLCGSKPLGGFGIQSERFGDDVAIRLTRSTSRGELGGDVIAFFDVGKDGSELDLSMASGSLEEGDATLGKNLVEEGARHAD